MSGDGLTLENVLKYNLREFSDVKKLSNAPGKLTTDSLEYIYLLKFNLIFHHTHKKISLPLDCPGPIRQVCIPQIIYKMENNGDNYQN